MTLTVDYPQPLEVARVLKAWRQAAGYTTEEIAVHANDLLPRSERRSREMYRRVEVGTIEPDKQPVTLLLAWAKACGADPADLGPWFVEATSAIRDLLKPYNAKASRGQPKRGNGWSSETPGDRRHPQQAA